MTKTVLTVDDSHTMRDMLLLALEGAGYTVIQAVDGVDGLEEIAGAVLTPDTLQHAWAQGVSPREALDAHDAHTFFGKLGQSLITGPTKTNVNDFRAILIT